MKFVIEKNVPISSRTKHEGDGFTAALRAMDVGDSFAIPKDKRNSMYSIARHVAGKKFMTRTVSETECRVWRIA